MEIGEKATIYLGLNHVRKELNKEANDYVRQRYDKIIKFIDTAFAKKDTLVVDDYFSIEHFQYVISSQLKAGNALVYYNRQQSFIDSISHRSERYGSTATRFYYLPDKRPFFAVREASGIIDDPEDMNDNRGYFDEYVKEGEKLQSLRKY